MPLRPANHEPRFPGFSAQIPNDVTEIVFLQYGVHTTDAEMAWMEADRLRPVFDGECAPDVLDRGSFLDVAGQANDVLLAYWFDRRRFEAWRDSARSVAQWSAHPDRGSAGFWRETAVIPRPRVETLYSHPQGFASTTGVSRAFEQADTPYHDYWGAARDRIEASHQDPLVGEIARLNGGAVTETRGRRLAVVGPANLCLIRTAQDWSVSTQFRDVYLNDVAPVKDAGVDFLRRTPDTGCIDARNITEADLDGRAMDRSCTVAWFISLKHLEDWSRSHRTHLAIYASFFKMVKESTVPLDVVFWHEVSVLPAGSVRGEYVNCHPECGLLRLGTGMQQSMEETLWADTTAS